MRSLPIAAFLGLGLLWGSDWLLAASLPAQPRLRALALEYAICAVLLLPRAIRRGVPCGKPSGVAKAVIAGVAILCLPQLLISFSNSRLSPAIALSALATVPVVLAIAGRLPITTSVCGLAGVLFLADSGLAVSTQQLLWLLLPLVAAGLLAWALAAVEVQLRATSISEMLFVQCTSSAVLLFLVSLLMERESLTWSAMAAVGFAVNGVLFIAAGYSVFYWLLARCGAGHASTLQWLQPLISTAEAAALMQIRPQWPACVGAMLIVIAITLVFSNRNEGGGVFFQITQSPSTCNR